MRHLPVSRIAPNRRPCRFALLHAPLQVRRQRRARNPRIGRNLDLDHGGRNSRPHREAVSYETSAITITLLMATALFIAAA
jgi:hypothetical protein